jgi:hypothetical protein
VKAPAAADVTVLVLLYNPPPGSELPKLKIETSISPAPLSPLVLFERGDASALAALVRNSEPLSTEVRCYVAGIVDGSVKRPRGNKRMRGLSLRDVSMMREIAASAKEKGIAKKDVICALVEFYGRSAGNIRDVLERRGAYAEK